MQRHGHTLLPHVDPGLAREPEVRFEYIGSDLPESGKFGPSRITKAFISTDPLSFADNFLFARYPRPMLSEAKLIR
jgi:hypothetical protein